MKHLFCYQDNCGQLQKAGLVLWKDRNIVCCMTNDPASATMDTCMRRGQGGLLELNRPTCTSKYNMYMGGVDVADMRHLHCSSTTMGQNRWWLKLFFYLLDVGTLNALVQYNEAMKDKQSPLNMVEVNTRLVDTLVGHKFEDASRGLDEVMEHAVVKIQGNYQKRCSYCALKSRFSRTQFICEGCVVPYCSIGSGKTTKDCFPLAHDKNKS